jgi:hypothetical protein
LPQQGLDPLGRRAGRAGQLGQDPVDLVMSDVEAREVVWQQPFAKPAHQSLALQQGIGHYLPRRR